jgi:hypothetical protein
MAHGHVHVFELDNKSKLSVFNLQFMNKDEIGVIKNALDKVMPKDRNDVYNGVVKTVNDMIVNSINSMKDSPAPIAGAELAKPK